MERLLRRLTNKSKTEQLRMTSYVNTEKNPADVLTKNVVEKNEQAWICDPKWDDRLLEQGECESELIYIVMTNIQMSRL